jgi:hypothetical protein
MTTQLFQGKNGGLPFPRTEDEWIEKKMSQGMSFEGAQKEAEHRVAQDVFGHDFKRDAKGNPIETGIGSANNQSPQHKMALEKAAEARAAARSRMGWNPSLENAHDPRKG